MISIIIPAYNAGKTIKRCLDSICLQTFIDFELIIVDDGSTDNTYDICLHYANKDPRISVVTKQNGGVSSARNLGLDLAKGEWVTFVDSDDWVGERFLEHLVVETKFEDLVIGYATYINHPTANDVNIHEFSVNITNYSLLFTEGLLHWRTSPWNKLFKRDILINNNICFDNALCIGEDAVFLYQYLIYTNSVKLIKSRDYFYVYDSKDSLTKRNYPLQTEIQIKESIVTAIDKLITLCNIREKDALRELFWLESTYVNRVINALYRNNIPFKKRREILSQIDTERYCKYFLLRDITLYRRLLSKLLQKKFIILYDLIRVLGKKMRCIYGIFCCNKNVR